MLEETIEFFIYGVMNQVHVLVDFLSTLQFSMDGWYLDDDGPSGGFSSELFNPSRAAFDRSSSLPSPIHDEVLACWLELGDSNLIEQQFGQASTFTACDGRDTEFEMSFLSKIDTNVGDIHHKSSHAYKGNEHQQFAPSSDDLAITRAMVAVISSSSSSSSSFSLLYQPQTLRQRKATSNQLSSFGPYNPSLAPYSEPKKSLSSQKMMRASHSMLRKIDQSIMEEGQTGETRSSSIQTHHIISERKRRKKLNDNFHTLRSLLPPGPKKDKASVLTNTKSYLSTLKAHISKLQEENTKLEMHLLSSEEAADTDELIDKVKFQIIKRVKSRSEILQQIELKITVRVGCDVIELVLPLLECLRSMSLARLISFDVNKQSHRMYQSVQATLILQIKDYDWDEEWFKEAMIRAVDRVVAGT